MWLRPRLLSAALLLPAMMASPTCPQTPTGPVQLDGLLDRARVLLIFAPQPGDAQLKTQLRVFAEHAEDMRERDLVALALPYHTLPSDGPSHTAPKTAQLPIAEAEAQRRRFRVAPGGFLVVLLGKDGGAKLRSPVPLSLRELNQTIDHMPMRQQEMRERRP